jgi:hypothetical protein
MNAVAKLVVFPALLLLALPAAAADAQSYDPHVGSGNITRSPYDGARYFGGIHRGWRAMVIPHRPQHGRHHREAPAVRWYAASESPVSGTQHPWDSDGQYSGDRTYGGGLPVCPSHRSSHRDRTNSR